MAYHNRLQNITLPAGDDFSSLQYRAVKLDSNGDAVLSAARDAMGVMQNIPKSGEAGTVAIRGATKCIVGCGGLAVGDVAIAAVSGYVTKASSSNYQGLPGEFTGKAMIAASSGGICTIELYV